MTAHMARRLPLIFPHALPDIMEATFAIDFPTQLLRIRLQILMYICLMLSSSNHASSIVCPEGYTENLDEDPHCMTWGVILFLCLSQPAGPGLCKNILTFDNCMCPLQSMAGVNPLPIIQKFLFEQCEDVPFAP